MAERTRVQLVASTGYYTPDVLPAYFHTHGPGRLVGGPDPLLELFLEDIEGGIAGTDVRAAMLKIVTDEQGLTPDVRRVMEAAATTQRRTGVPSPPTPTRLPATDVTSSASSSTAESPPTGSSSVTAGTARISTTSAS